MLTPKVFDAMVEGRIYLPVILEKACMHAFLENMHGDTIDYLRQAKIHLDQGGYFSSQV